jgi:hypothetical protein
MSNKKHKNKHKKTENDLLYSVDYMLDNNYVDVMNEIEMYQAEIKRADKKAKKKAMKKFNKKGFYPYEYQVHAREHVIQEMSDSSFMDRIINALNQMTPVVLILSRLVAALIVSILNLSIIRSKISKKTLRKLENVYNIAMSLC